LQLHHKLLRDQLPLHVQREAHFVDPPIEPRTTVGLVEGLGGKVQFQFRVILGEEQVLASVIEIILGDCLPPNHGRHLLVILGVVILPSFDPALIGDHSTVHFTKQRAALLRESCDEVLRGREVSHAVALAVGTASFDPIVDGVRVLWVQSRQLPDSA
jgi:hypothetical protein